MNLLIGLVLVMLLGIFAMLAMIAYYLRDIAWEMKRYSDAEAQDREHWSSIPLDDDCEEYEKKLDEILGDDK